MAIIVRVCRTSLKFSNLLMMFLNMWGGEEITYCISLTKQRIHEDTEKPRNTMKYMQKTNEPNADNMISNH